MCPEEDSASVEWARQKDENWVNLKDGMMPRKSNMDKSMLKSLHLPA